MPEAVRRQNNKRPMKKSFSLAAIFMAMAFVANVQTAYADRQGFNPKEPACALPAENLLDAANDNFNFKSFEVVADAAQAYFVEFWLQPAKYINGQYTTFYVYLNNHYVGSITPTEGRWQSAHIDNMKSLELLKGTNVITVATRAPEMPAVERVNIALNEAEAVFSSEAYDRYLDDIVSDNMCDAPEDEGLATLSNNAAGIAYFTNVPLRYSFYRTFSFTKNQEVFIATTSDKEHFIDVVYYATPVIRPRPAMDLELVPNKPFPTYNIASSEEMQGLNWKGISEKAVNTNEQMATVRFKAPKTGFYLIRLRSKNQAVSGLANLNVNGTYYYENSPFNFAGVRCEIPADGKEYATMTNCANTRQDDPILFIHGCGVADKLVGVNDDGPREKLNQYNLYMLDSYISQKYFMKTYQISVNNYSSLKPVSSCNILARVVNNEEASAAALMKSAHNTTTDIKDVRTESVSISSGTGLNSDLIISADADIENVSAYNLAGVRIGSIACEGRQVSVPMSSLNMTYQGIYVVRIETGEGIQSKKVIIR